MLEMVRAGLHNSVQDQGRYGFRHLGVAQAGALDVAALWQANRLVQNAGGAAGLEIMTGPVVIRFHRDSWIALTGAVFQASIEGSHHSQIIANGWRSQIRAGQVLRLQGPVSGRCAYLAVDGGIDVATVMESRSTDFAAKLGGLDGRALRNGDWLATGPAYVGGPRVGVLQRSWTPEIRVLRGPEFEQFNAAAQDDFFSAAWQVSPQSNRMGFRLQGTPLQRSVQQDLPSHAVFPGVVQVPPSGQPIVLMADAQATGGYPRIATVIAADMWKLAQAQSGARFCFVPTDRDGAALARKQWEQELYRMEWSLYGKGLGHRPECRPG